MKSIGLIANPGKPRAGEVVRRIVRLCKALGIDVCADTPTAKLMHRRKGMPHGQMFEKVDAIVAIGGDGTMLRAVRQLDGRDKPMLGVNIGSLGFLTSVAENELELALRSFAKDRLVYSVRSIAECSVMRRGRKIGSYRALNDIVVRTGLSARVVSMDVIIDGDFVTSFVCDGLMVSTPTGSTGHSLSAGGPILSPETPAFVINLICPHTLGSRPLVVPDRSEIVIRPTRCGGDLLLSVDGQIDQALAPGDVVNVSRSSASVRFLHLAGHSYYSVLRQKLRWSGSNL